MADKDQDNDEYKFTETDFEESNPEQVVNTEAQSTPKYGINPYNPNVRRNVLIVLGTVLVLFVLYKIWSPGSKPKPATSEITPVVQAPVQTVQPEIKPTPLPQPVLPPPPDVDSELKQKVATIESSQQSVSSQVSTMSEQMGSVGTNMNNLVQEIGKLNQTISALSVQVAKQSDEMRIMMIRSRPKPRPVRMRSMPGPAIVIYYIKAIIPGRAWLIGTDGSTLTVRDGIPIKGYGVVRMIDSVQGRVITSSGKTIRFSQEDS